MNDMGLFYTMVQIEHHARRGDRRELHDVLVDTGAESTWIPRSVLESLGVPVEKVYIFQMADGRLLTRDIGYAIIHVEARQTTEEVTFGEPGDLSLLGARALEGLSLRVDSREKRLVSSGPKITAAVA
jgi:predicted aspartyl protease